MSLAWYPFYVGDYARDTADLSCLEHGCFRLLLDASWARGPLPNDLNRLCRLAAGCDAETVRFILERYWVLAETDAGEVWANARLEAVRTTQDKEHAKQVIGAALTNYKRFGSEKSKATLERYGVDVPKLSLSDSGSDSGSVSGSCRNQNQNQNQKEDINIGENFVSPIEKVSAKKPAKRFVPPTVAEVADYCTERSNHVDPESFVDHYEANGWMRGKTKLKNWKAAVRTWEKNHEAHSNNTARHESAHERRKRINQEIRDRAMSHFSEVG